MKDWENVDCPICGTAKHLKPFYLGITTWEHPGEFNYHKCSKCDLVLQSPRITISKIGIYYPKATYWGQDISSASTYPNYKKDRWYHYGRIYKDIFARKSGGSILDIGSGLGLFLSLFKEKGWEVLGTETAPAIAKFSLKAFSVPVQVGELSKLKLPSNHFDVVTLLGVFEHLYDPLPSLQIIKRILKKDGLLVIVPPNFASLGRLVFGRKWYSMDPGRHVFHYTPATIAKILKKAGFEVEEITHNHWLHNQYSWFINIRYLFSPKEKVPTQTAITSTAKSKTKINPVKEVGKIAAWIVSVGMAYLEMLVRRGESMMVYVKIKN